MKKIICGLFNHKVKPKGTENAEGKMFKFVSSCSCGKQKIKSVPLHDNDLLGCLNINEWNYPVEK